MALADRNPWNPKCYPALRKGQVIDIGGSQLKKALEKVLSKKLIGKDDQNRHFLCDFLFSDDKGLAIWKKINTLPSYYQTDNEVELLERNGKHIVELLVDGVAIIDMGCG